MLINIKGLAFSPEGVRAIKTESRGTDAIVVVEYHDGGCQCSAGYRHEEAEAERQRVLEEIDASGGVGLPEEPTEAMIEAGRRELSVGMTVKMSSDEKAGWAMSIYRAMVAAYTAERRSEAGQSR